eukprot:TRINITY_DN3740_c0_g2_i1.p1 TRINITY_DN3740_c0_g2~~TRINITY_DN3740_c0_g2_i1.p1  ORF type:complete len:363 (-),score=78.16 TRINITY_DN3740_c0_g2_i1:92-1180(-)
MQASPEPSSAEGWSEQVWMDDMPTSPVRPRRRPRRVSAPIFNRSNSQDDPGAYSSGRRASADSDYTTRARRGSVPEGVSELTPEGSTSCAAAIMLFEAHPVLNKDKRTACEAKTVKLHGMWPPIVEMDCALNQLSACEHLHLSSNRISAIEELPGLINLRVLSLGRNCITTLQNLRSLRNLEQLLISYNRIESLQGVESLEVLQVLDLGHNQVSTYDGLAPLAQLQDLRELTLTGNPLQLRTVEAHGARSWAVSVFKLIGQLTVLDGTAASKWRRRISDGNADQLTEVFHLINAEGGTQSPTSLRSTLRDPAVCAAVMHSPKMLALREDMSQCDRCLVEKELKAVYSPVSYTHLTLPTKRIV